MYGPLVPLHRTHKHNVIYNLNKMNVKIVIARARAFMCKYIAEYPKYDRMTIYFSYCGCHTCNQLTRITWHVFLGKYFLECSWSPVSALGMSYSVQHEYIFRNWYLSFGRRKWNFPLLFDDASGMRFEWVCKCVALLWNKNGLRQQSFHRKQFIRFGIFFAQLLLYQISKCQSHLSSF